MPDEACADLHKLDVDARQAVAASLLAVGRSVISVADALSVNQSTVRRWLDQPDFRRLVSVHRSTLMGEALGRLAAAATKAVDVLEGSLDSDNESNRLKAAMGILDRLATMREQTELAERLADIEAKLEQKKGNRQWG
jgi:transposase-like protein